MSVKTIVELCECVNCLFAQGAKLAVVNAADLIQILMLHPGMKDLRIEAAGAYVQRETGAVAGIAHTMQAATTPSEGQRLLQKGFEGAIINGESREKTTTETNADGNVAVQRVVERGVVTPDGQQVLVQQVQQTAVPEVVTVGVLHTCLTGIASAFDKVKLIINSHDTIITSQDAIIVKHAALVDLVATSITTLHVQVDKKMEVLGAKMEANDNRASQLQTQSEEFEKRLASLETSKKRLRKSEQKDSPKISRNISFANGCFSWRKTINKKQRSKSGYKTIANAQEGLAKFCNEENAMSQD